MEIKKTTKRKVKSRKKLQFKILDKYTTIKEFCEDIGYSYANAYGVVVGDRDGTLKFWSLAQKALDIPDEEMWSYQKREGEKSNE